jgi:SAM-dependent methyltransferase
MGRVYGDEHAYIWEDVRCGAIYKTMTYTEQLVALYSAQCALSDNSYLRAHSRNRAVIARQISIFERCKNFIPASGAILDWGCHHAPDSCLIKMLRGEDVQLYGCDTGPGEFQAFFNFANLKYSQLEHPYIVPYDDCSFDAVIGGGVLEHVPNDSKSLEELYRILKPGGFFVMTALPNRLSYTEWLSRRMGSLHHNRLYALKEIKQTFLHHGFLPVASGHHQVLPSFATAGSAMFDSPILNRLVENLFPLNEIVEKIWPIYCFSASIFVVGKKTSMV